MNNVRFQLVDNFYRFIIFGFCCRKPPLTRFFTSIDSFSVDRHDDNHLKRIIINFRWRVPINVLARSPFARNKAAANLFLIFLSFSRL